MTALSVQYSPVLVIVSVILSMIAANLALSMADRMRVAKTAIGRKVWLVGGSLAMGSGIWSMHYLGMLAVKLPVPVFYYWPIVLSSLLLAVAASMVALMAVSAPKPGWTHLMRGSLLMAAGIGGMHYTGMAAMRSAAMEHYNLWLVALSIAAAFGFSWMALGIAFKLQDDETYHPLVKRTLGGCVMGLGIAAMHYVAMAGVTFEISNMSFSTAGAVRVDVLGEVMIAAMVGLVMAGALGMAAFHKRKLEEIREANMVLEVTQQALLASQKELLEANAILNDLSIRDGLTGLHNRRHFDAVLDSEWRRAARKQEPISLLLLDVDKFKKLNDTYGHQHGDECLRQIAEALQDGPRRSYDVMARYGGEEFAVLLPEADLLAAQEIAERVRHHVWALGIEHRSCEAGVVTVSIGVCSRTPLVFETSESFVRAADAALYAAKAGGRNRVETSAGTVVDSEVRV